MHRREIKESPVNAVASVHGASALAGVATPPASMDNPPALTERNWRRVCASRLTSSLCFCESTRRA